MEMGDGDEAEGVRDSVSVAGRVSRLVSIVRVDRPREEIIRGGRARLFFRFSALLWEFLSFFPAVPLNPWQR